MANSVVFGIFSTRTQVETAVDAMKREGFRNADISVLFPQNEGTKDFALEKGTKAPEGAAAGATSGAVIGGTAGAAGGTATVAAGGRNEASIPAGSPLTVRLTSPLSVMVERQDPDKR